MGDLTLSFEVVCIVEVGGVIAYFGLCGLYV